MNPHVDAVTRALKAASSADERNFNERFVAALDAEGYELRYADEAFEEYLHQHPGLGFCTPPMPRCHDTRKMYPYPSFAVPKGWAPQ